MFESLARLQLKRKGLSCGRTRRKQSDNAIIQALWENPWIKALILLAFFATVLFMVLYTGSGNEVFASQQARAAVVVGIIFLAAFVQFYLNHPRSFCENSRVLLVFGSILFQLALLKLTLRVVEVNGWTPNYLFLLAPFAFAPMLLSVLMGRHLGMFAAACSSLFGALIMDGNMVLQFIIFNLICSFTGVYVADQIRKRSRLIRAGLNVGLATLLLAMAMGYLSAIQFDAPGETDWQRLGLQCLMPLVVGVATATFIGGILPMIESLFRITTQMSWLELADLNHPLLRRMTLEAPGTYHHSLVVANLSEAAAEKIRANAIMCRVCSYFHDIGKLLKPEYYIENITEENNPHDDLTPNMSMLIIMAHVKDGVDLAIKHKLNNAIIDIIEEHHGTSLVYYFYRRALEQKEEMEKQVAEGKAHQEDIPEVVEKGFRYPGPKPTTRESAIVSLADAVEGASRALQKPTPQKIEQMVDEIVRARVRDNQLDDCDLTLQELAEVKKSFCATLRSMMHNRISYPKETSLEEDRKKATRRSQGKARQEQKKNGKKAEPERPVASGNPV